MSRSISNKANVSQDDSGDYLVQVGEIKISMVGTNIKNFGGFLMCALMVIAMVGFVVTYSEMKDSLLGVLINLIIIVLIFWYGVTLMRRGNRYIKYVSLIVAEGEKSVRKIAEAIPTKYEVALKDIYRMLDKEILTGFDFVDIQLTKNIGKTAETSNTTKREVSQGQTRRAVVASKSSPKESVVICCGCGAKNVVKADEVGICEYCEGPISYKE